MIELENRTSKLETRAELLESKSLSADYFYTNPETISLVGHSLSCPYTWTANKGQTVHFQANVSTKKSRELHALNLNLRVNDEIVATSQFEIDGSELDSSISLLDSLHASIIYNE